MYMATAKVTPKGQIVIPAEYRKKYKIDAPGQVLITEREGRLVILPMPDDPIGGARGMLKSRQPLDASQAAYKKEEMSLEDKK